MLESREFPNKESKDAFWVEACQVLGDIADPRSIKPLTDWAQTYNLMEKRKEKSLLVRRAAIQALGRFQRDYVKTFLENLINEGDPALIDVVSEAHEQVVARLEKTPGAPNPAD
jgi:HEAT repeat protein